MLFWVISRLFFILHRNEATRGAKSMQGKWNINMLKATTWETEVLFFLIFLQIFFSLSFFQLAHASLPITKMMEDEKKMFYIIYRKINLCFTERILLLCLFVGSLNLTRIEIIALIFHSSAKKYVTIEL